MKSFFLAIQNILMVCHFSCPSSCKISTIFLAKIQQVHILTNLNHPNEAHELLKQALASPATWISVLSTPPSSSIAIPQIMQRNLYLPPWNTTINTMSIHYAHRCGLSINNPKRVCQGAEEASSEPQNFMRKPCSWLKTLLGPWKEHLHKHPGLRSRWSIRRTHVKLWILTDGPRLQSEHDAAFPCRGDNTESVCAYSFWHVAEMPLAAWWSSFL